MNTEQQLFIQMGLLLSFVFLPLSNSWSPLLSKKKMLILPVKVKNSASLPA